MARPSKLTEDVKNTIVDAILHGCTYADAAGAAGVHYDTFNNWMQAGAKAKSGQYFEFFEAVSTANAECAKNFTRIIQVAAAKGDWKAALEWLKRRRPVDWGDASRVDVTTGGESLAPKLSDEERLTRMKELALAIAKELNAGKPAE